MTIKEIARLAGVSSAAVSRYLNGGYVSEEKKEKIREIIEKTGYRPSIQARNLRTRQTRLVGVVVPKISSETISRVTDGIGKILQEKGYQMLLATTDNNPEKELEYMELFENYPVDGVILIATILTRKHRKHIRETKIPIVVIGQHLEGENCVYHDDYGAAKEMGIYVGKSGKQKIAYIGVTREDKAVGTGREDGFLSGLAKCGIKMKDGLRKEAKFTMESGYEKAFELLRDNSDIDIISCATDTIAAGALEAIQKDFPERKGSIQITGFGDNQFLKAVTGGIPTVHFGYKTSGVKGAELLIDIIENGQDISVQMKLGYEIKNLQSEKKREQF